MQEKEQLIRTEYSEIMRQSYIDYAMSVIVSRALPDIRDGLKPVQRRTLYDMYELGIRYDRPYRKCARIVGDTMGKYHPHGDSSIYDALVVLAQDFKKGQALVDGHGNFGSIEGDGAAAMRYTEARLEQITQDVYLSDLDKDIVNFVPNFDETEKEPEVLPVRIPNFLVNGAEGIAVGMATSVPSHNLAEVCEGVKAYMRNPNISLDELMEYIKGPDFPTGGIVVNQKELKEIYQKGSGKIRIRGKVEIEKMKGGKSRLVISEIPYPMVGANIGKFLNDVAGLVESRATTDITDISNQSSKEGIRIVLELKKDADIEGLKNLLYKKTRLEDTFGLNMLAVVQGRPETLSLQQVLEHHMDFQFEITTRKYRNLLDRELEKKEVQEGLIKACDVIDLIIEILRGSRSRQQVKLCLTKGETEDIRFKTKRAQKQAARLSFTEKQADAILDMRLHRLIGLEIESLLADHEKTLGYIAEYENILNNYDAMAEVIIRDLDRIRESYGRPRRTALDNKDPVVLEEKKKDVLEVAVLIDRFGYAKTIDRAVYEKNLETLQEDYMYCFPCSTDDKLCLFTEKGRMHSVKVMDLPFGKQKDKGSPLDNFGNYKMQDERLLLVELMSSLQGRQLLFVTERGLVKLVAGEEFQVSKATIAASKLGDEDQLAGVFSADEMDYLVIKTRNGYFLRFLKREVSLQKKNALGVKGIELQGNDLVDQVWMLASGNDFSVSYEGRDLVLGKLRLGKRAGKGVKIKKG